MFFVSNAQTANVTFEDQNVTVRNIQSKESEARVGERWGHVEIIGAGKVYFSLLSSKYKGT